MKNFWDAYLFTRVTVSSLQNFDQKSKSKKRNRSLENKKMKKEENKSNGVRTTDAF